MIYKGIPAKERKERAMEALKIVGLTKTKSIICQTSFQEDNSKE